MLPAKSGDVFRLLPSRPKSWSVCRFSTAQFVVVAHKDAQSKTWRLFRVPSHQLLFVVIEMEIKCVFWIQIDQHEIGVAHRELAKSELVSAVRHVIGCRQLPVRCFLGFTENLYDLPCANLHLCDASNNVRRRKKLLWIKQQIVLLYFDAMHFAGFNQ